MDENNRLTGTLLHKKPKGYGTSIPEIPQVASHMKPKDIISHKVTPSDTLSSLAIMYDSNIGDIKRLNKLWNNESLGFKERIVIPIYHDRATTNDASRSIREPLVPSTSTAATNISDIKVTLSSSTTCADDSTNMNGLDFLAKFDKSLSLIKKKVDSQTANSAEFLDEEDILYETVTTRPKPHTQNGYRKVSHRASTDSTSSATRFSIHSQSSSDDVRLTPEPVIRSNVKKKLERHERRQDEELFTL